MSKWYRVFEDATKLFTAEISVDPGDEWYPPMVVLDIESGSLLDYDAEALGLAIQEAAAEAKRQLEAKRKAV